MKKHASCPWGCKVYDLAIRDMAGRKPRTAETQRKRIDELLGIMQSEGDFWTLEVIRRLLTAYVLYDDRFEAISFILQNLNRADSRQLKKISTFASTLCSLDTPQKRRKKP